MSSPRPAEAVIPRATYRVQLHSEFRFEDATALVPYWADLGISHLYISPPLRARPGSQHGYDVVAHNELNPELGTREDFDRMIEALHRHEMGLLVDIVPNHMGVLGGDNAWWLDVLENGAAAEHAEYFDIDWSSADPALTGRVLLPILGDQYGIVLERGELKLGFEADEGRFTLSYYEHRLPIDPARYGDLLRRAARGFDAKTGGQNRQALEHLAEAFDRLPAHDTEDSAAQKRRQTEQPELKARLAEAARANPALKTAIEKATESINGRQGDRTSFDALDTLINAQPYRLAQWRVAGDQINYRRFFDINDLAALSMERSEVFEDTHRLILELAASGAIDGLRIDHPDGLADPAAYFEQLQRRYAEVAGLPAPPPPSDGKAEKLPLYVVVEKIVAPHEEVPRSWAVHGTTGYRFANVINGLMIDGNAKARLDRAWRVFVKDDAEDFEELSWHCRHIVMESSLAGELSVLSNALLRLARGDRRTRDFTLNSLRRALAEVVASFPVYRTYIIDKASAQDRKFIDWAIGSARRHAVGEDPSVFDFLRRVMLGRPLPGAPAGLADRYRVFARRIQQYTAPVAAKGIEDTALYRHQRLISVNDVGGEPDSFGMSIAAFHAASRDRAQNWPHTMLATSTHDAKRSEDVRARIDVISELPAAWRLTVKRWARMNRRHKRTVAGNSAPSRNDEYLLYQMLVGSLPNGPLGDEELTEYADRIEAAMLKSARESKLVTSWINPNAPYEAALSHFIHELLAARENNLFLEDLQVNGAVFAWYGALNSITIATFKALSPGVPDFYQGCEAIELALVDPDNRRPVDYARRRELLAKAHDLAARPDRSDELHEWLQHAPDGRAKFYATSCALRLRREHGDALRDADYIPLEVEGERASNVVAFARHDGKQWVIVVGGRLYAGLGLEVGELPIGKIWGDTVINLPQLGDEPFTFSLTDAISGQTLQPQDGKLAVSKVLKDFPVATLTALPP
ncbi:MAG: malto-oligosyltrehalose synthase [Burkholderiales bacterium]